MRLLKVKWMEICFGNFFAFWFLKPMQTVKYHSKNRIIASKFHEWVSFKGLIVIFLKRDCGECRYYLVFVVFSYYDRNCGMQIFNYFRHREKHWNSGNICFKNVNIYRTNCSTLLKNIWCVFWWKNFFLVFRLVKQMRASKENTNITFLK